MQYSGKNVLVTGVAQGIGKAIAEAYIGTGATVIGFDVQPAVIEGVHHYHVDLGYPEAVVAAFTDIKHRFGTLHVLINNGAISHFCKPLQEVTIQQFSKVIDVNLRGSFVCTSEFVRINEGQHYGRIINIASTRWLQNEMGWDAYGASKGGVVPLTNSLAISLSKPPITVNAISPVWIETAGYAALTEQDHSQHPSGRVNTCLFLSDEENDFINGANIVVDGGMTGKMIYQ